MVAAESRGDTGVSCSNVPTRKAAVLLVLRYYGRELLCHRRVAVPGPLLPALGDTCLVCLVPVIVARLAGRLAAGADTGAGTVLPYVLGFAALMVLAEGLWRIGLHCMNRTAGRGIENLYVIGLNELLAKDTAFFHDNFAGSLTKRVVSFAARFEDFVDTLAYSVIAKILPLVFASVVLWRYDGLLVVILVSLILVSALIIAPLVRRRQALVGQREAAVARVSGHIADSVMNMDTVRAFAAEGYEAAEHHRRVAEQRGLCIRSWDYTNLRIDSVVAPLYVLTNTLGLLVALSLGGGQRGVEALVVTFVYYLNATRVIFEFNQTYRRLENCVTEAAQFTELLFTPPTVLDPISPEPLRPTTAQICFRQVSFAYTDASPLFTGLDLIVPSGRKMGLVGRSGAGKTTLLRLLLRLMDVDQGHIFIGDQDISRLRQADLRSLIAYVPQEPTLFHRTLRDNIAFARPGASDAEIHRAAQAAHVTEFAQALPEGLDTMVGERGIKLSGGQRQRVAIARAILRDAPILLLDEATSALDSESESLIQHALWQLMARRTALVVAHRLSTVIRMDQLVVLDKGRILEQGTHDELLDKQGIYAMLWHHQSDGFFPDNIDASRSGQTIAQATQRGVTLVSTRNQLSSVLGGNGRSC
jgi:ATP-binding cassette, subfamily B, bacterial